jgi:hypothetical protein
MSAKAMPLDPEINGSSGVKIPDRIHHGRMIVQADIDARKGTSGSHVVLAIQQFLGRTPEDFDRAWYPGFVDQVLESDRRPKGRGSNQVVATAMAIGMTTCGCRLARHSVITEAGQGIKLHEEAKARPAIAAGCNPGGFKPTDASIRDRKSLLLKGFADISGTSIFFISQFRILPNMRSNIPDQIRQRINLLLKLPVIGHGYVTRDSMLPE